MFRHAHRFARPGVGRVGVAEFAKGKIIAVGNQGHAEAPKLPIRVEREGRVDSFSPLDRPSSRTIAVGWFVRNKAAPLLPQVRSAMLAGGAQRARQSLTCA